MHDDAFDSDWPLRRDPSFRRFWLARFMSAVGSGVGNVIFPLLVYRLTHSTVLTATLATAQILPYVVFGVFAGVSADRFDRRRIMLSADLVGALAFASVPVVAATGHLHVGVVFLAVIVSKTAYVWFDAANFGALPALVGRRRVVSATASVSAAVAVAAVAGPAIGGAALMALTEPAVLALSATAFMASALLLLAMRLPDRPVAPAETGSRSRSTSNAIGEAMTYIWSHVGLRPLTALAFPWSLASGTFLGMQTLYAVESLGVAGTGPAISLLFVASGVGTVAGAAAVPHLLRRWNVGTTTVIAVSVMTAALLGLAFVHELSLALPLVLLLSFGSAAVSVNFVSYRLQVVPDALRGRVNTIVRTIAFAGSAIGPLFGGLLAEQGPLSFVTGAMAVLMGATSLVAWRSVGTWATPPGLESPPIQAGHRLSPQTSERAPAVAA